MSRSSRSRVAPAKARRRPPPSRSALEAAKAVDPERIETELIELADLKLNGNMAAGIPLEPGQQDDFPELAAKLATAGGWGHHHRLARLLRLHDFALQGISRPLHRAADAAVCAGEQGRRCLAVGGVRNGGQELTLQAIQAAMMCQEMVVVGDGRPTCHTGATVWNSGKDDISQDEFGLGTVKNLGRRVAEVALRMAAGK